MLPFVGSTLQAKVPCHCGNTDKKSKLQRSDMKGAAVGGRGVAAGVPSQQAQLPRGPQVFPQRSALLMIPLS